MALNNQDLANARDTRGATDWGAVTPGAGDLPKIPSWLMVSADATVTITSLKGTSVALPLKAGVMYPLHPTKITVVSVGTCYALYGEGPSA